jgi:hypothetical protein
MSEAQAIDRHRHDRLVRSFRIHGPGLVTGASDGDPSGIAWLNLFGWLATALVSAAAVAFVVTLW